MKLKVCGMKYYDNITEVANLQPDYFGFIFYEKSARYFNGTIPEIPETIKKVGVFVNATVEEIIEKVNKYNLQAVQLHGNESPEFCEMLRPLNIKIIKVFSIKDTFDFSILKSYELVCDYYLFDTKGKLPGGNGYTFNWNVLKDYPSAKPFFLSGGIGLEENENLQKFLKTKASKKCHAIDVNSKFETEPGLKIIELLKKFKSQV
ncbi:phosphoribosylanthranilate isomerase [Yeosuana sp. MJ-SS3]|uniref:N-(5'-phosphoribosyl)anthranilate isomerase n=1 Tax=Gilvirhabdus luticola TaxID=3079858 RepID=A0ABU3U4V5_9FLAO|nr:phosphoribosylanthranilate isomerase [Yeosuana sp. MJ-SS3]MDU8885344.1 phosphoribosylanthranilate isomerase [Yeosuana sp. MJ-SS3]